MSTKCYVNLMGMKELQKFLKKMPVEEGMKAVDQTLDEYAAKAVKNIKAEFGVYQGSTAGPGGTTFPAWAPLKQATIDNKKVRTGQDTPLLDSGALQESITSLKPNESLRLVGTEDPNGAYMEYGTPTVPARPWLRPVLWALGEPFKIALRRRLIDLIKAKYTWVKRH